jgi:hypothetical protein
MLTRPLALLRCRPRSSIGDDLVSEETLVADEKR